MIDTQNNFASLAEQYMNMVYRIAFHDTGSACDADDITQEVFLRLFRASPRFDSQEHAKYWLIRVTINECKRLRLSSRRRRTVPLNEYINTLYWELPEQQEVLQEIMTLPRKYRVPLYLYYYEGYSTDEIAKILQRSPGTVRTQLSRGREQLRHILSKEGWSDA